MVTEQLLSQASHHQVAIFFRPRISGSLWMVVFVVVIVVFVKDIDFVYFGLEWEALESCCDATIAVIRTDSSFVEEPFFSTLFLASPSPLLCRNILGGGNRGRFRVVVVVAFLVRIGNGFSCCSDDKDKAVN